MGNGVPNYRRPIRPTTSMGYGKPIVLPMKRPHTQAYQVLHERNTLNPLLPMCSVKTIMVA
jgi:hypothetical protein